LPFAGFAQQTHAVQLGHVQVREEQRRGHALQQFERDTSVHGFVADEAFPFHQPHEDAPKVCLVVGDNAVRRRDGRIILPHSPP
jgi:hypothetical protein